MANEKSMLAPLGKVLGFLSSMAIFTFIFYNIISRLVPVLAVGYPVFFAFILSVNLAYEGIRTVKP
jgi:hypothetical protein